MEIETDNWQDGKKRCGNCRQYKTPDQYSKRAASRDGLQSRCLACQTKYKLGRDKAMREYIQVKEAREVYPQSTIHPFSLPVLCAAILRDALDAYNSPIQSARLLASSTWYVRGWSDEKKQDIAIKLRDEAADFLRSPDALLYAEAAGIDANLLGDVLNKRYTTRRNDERPDTWNDRRARIREKYAIVKK